MSMGTIRLKAYFQRGAILILAFAACVCGAREADFWKASGQNGAIATGGPKAADAGLAALRDGGNAIDAAVSAMLVLSVTDSGNFCFGSEVPILVYDAEREAVEVLSGVGTAPELATAEYFRSHGGIPGGDDPRTAAVPGALDAFITALERYGTFTFAEAAAPMLEALEKADADWHVNLKQTIKRLIKAEKQAPDDRLRGLRLVADYFYRGPIAREIDDWSRANGGLLRYSDLATHTTRIENPVSIRYGGHTIYKCGPWSQGPYLLETLQLLKGFNLKDMGHNSTAYTHTLIEAMKLGLADRDTYYADPHFQRVPLDGLLSEWYADLRRPLIDPERASLRQRPGDPRRKKVLLIQNPRTYQSGQSEASDYNDTTTCVVSDRHGNMVAATPSGWGGVTAGETGVILGSRLRSFNTWEGHPNCIEPDKRPRITLTPTLVTKDGEPTLGISVAGGDWQDQVTLQVLLNILEHDMPPAEAVTAVRFGTHNLIGSFNQPPPEPAKLSVYADIGDQVIEALEGKGHKVEVVEPPFWHPVALTVDPETGTKRAAGDPNADRHAKGY